jgi:hypothetical protein
MRNAVCTMEARKSFGAVAYSQGSASAVSTAQKAGLLRLCLSEFICARSGSDSWTGRLPIGRKLGNPMPLSFPRCGQNREAGLLTPAGHGPVRLALFATHSRWQTRTSAADQEVRPTKLSGSRLGNLPHTAAEPQRKSLLHFNQRRECGRTSACSRARFFAPHG